MFAQSPASGPVVDDLLRATVAEYPDRPALGPLDRAVDFRTFDARVNRIANGLLAEGAPGDRIAIVGRNSEEQVELMFAIARAGQVVLPINWRLSPREIAYILAHSGAARVFADREFADAVESAREGRDISVLFLDDGGPDGFAAWRDRQSEAAVLCPATAGDVVLQMYTSGTTGLPKGVLLTNANVMDSIAIFSRPPMDLDAADVIYAPAPMFHITGIGPVLRMAQSGARLVVSGTFHPDDAVRTMAREGVSYTTLAPAMIHACLVSPAFEGADLSRLRLIAYGGSPISEAVLNDARERIGCAFAQCYGLTESTGPITVLTPEDHAPDRDLLLSCGRAAGNIEIRVVGPDGTERAPGETGEILVRGGVVMAGYARNAEATEQTVREGWLYTGDAGYLDAEGYLFIRDRVKDMIVSGGENIYPVEVENALQAHPHVADVAVIGVPHPHWGESVLAMIVPHAGESADPLAILDFCRERIAGYKCPKEIQFTDAIPRNAAGKILRREIRKPFWEGQERLVG